MTLKANTAETGLTSGTAVSAANSDDGAAGDAFLSTSAGSGGTLTYDTAQAMHGTLSWNFTPGGTQGCSVLMSDSTPSPNFTASVYIYPTGSPSSATVLFQVQTAAGTNVCRLHLNTSRQLQCVNQAGSVVSTFTNALPLNAWTRINLWGTVHASAGTINASMYSGDSLSATETKNLTSQNTGSTDAARVAFGKLTGALTIATFYGDDFRMNIGSASELGLPIIDGEVLAVEATATAAALAPTVNGIFNASVSAVTATATAAAGIPGINDGSGAPAFRDSAGALGGSTVTSLTLTIPGTVQADDYGIIVSLVGGATGAATAPAGWSTLVNDQLTTTGSGRISIFGRRFVAGDANPQVVWASAPASGNNNALLGVWYSGVGTPVVGSFGLSGTASTTWTAPALTTTSADHTVLAISGERGNSGGWPSIATWSPDATMRASRYGTGNFYPAIVIGDMPQNTAGTTDAQTATWNFSTNSAFGVQLDLPPTAVGASVSAVTGTATAAGLAPTPGSNELIFSPDAEASALAPIPVILAASGVTGGGPMTASALILPPGVRQRIILTVQATATAAAIPPPALTSSNVVPVATASAVAVAPAVTGQGYVEAVAATADADALAPTLEGDVQAPAATATASGVAPTLGESSVRPPAATASAVMFAPLVGGVVAVVAATADAAMLAPQAKTSGFVLAARATALAGILSPVVGHREQVFRTPTYFMHYNEHHPLLKRIKYPTGIAVLLIDGFYIAVEFPDDEQLVAATKVYLGGRDYVLTVDEVDSLTDAGYGEFINEEVFVS